MCIHICLQQSHDGTTNVNHDPVAPPQKEQFLLKKWIAGWMSISCSQNDCQEGKKCLGNSRVNHFTNSATTGVALSRNRTEASNIFCRCTNSFRPRCIILEVLYCKSVKSPICNNRPPASCLPLRNMETQVECKLLARAPKFQ